MSNEFQHVERFLRDWVQEFSRSVEMFSGESATVSCASAAAPNPKSLIRIDEYLWLRQDLGADEAFTTWIGATEATWSALGSAMADEGADASKKIYLEMLDQAQQGAATLLSGRIGEQIRCKEAQTGNSPELASLLTSEIRINFRGGDLPPLIYGVDSVMARLLGGSDESADESDGSNAEVPNHPYGPMLDRLMDLELPLSVALGRAVMPIQEVLKMTSGSLIELDRTVGDYVELLVHGTVVARGEVVSIKGNYGVRIKQIISREDRIALHRHP